MIDQPGLLQKDSTALHHNEIRNTHDIEALRQLRRLLRIHLQNNRASGHFCCGTVNFRRGRSAGSAPCRPEIDQYRHAGVGNNVIEGIDVNIDGFGDWRQWGFTCAAPSHVGKMAGGNPVLLSTAGTRSNHWIIPGLPHGLRNMTSLFIGLQILFQKSTGRVVFEADIVPLVFGAS